MLRHRDPAILDALQAVGRDEAVVGVDAQRVVEANPHGNAAANQGGRHTVAVATDLNVAIPTDLAVLVIGRIVTLRG